MTLGDDILQSRHKEADGHELVAMQFRFKELLTYCRIYKVDLSVSSLSLAPFPKWDAGVQQLSSAKISCSCNYQLTSNVYMHMLICAADMPMPGTCWETQDRALWWALGKTLLRMRIIELPPAPLHLQLAVRPTCILCGKISVLHIW